MQLWALPAGRDPAWASLRMTDLWSRALPGNKARVNDEWFAPPLVRSQVAQDHLCHGLAIPDRVHLNARQRQPHDRHMPDVDRRGQLDIARDAPAGLEDRGQRATGKVVIGCHQQRLTLLDLPLLQQLGDR